ncbi:carbohydrate kinase family protein [Candidatus Bathyarchaeota archaeon]|nr:carbohydrate kinase family protein [Candidatus Bathyarchaeota archaeon]
MADLICCGAINWDINLFMERLPRTGEEVPVKEIQRVSGGTAANVSVAAARILGSGRVAFIGALGEDPIAEQQIGILRDEGVDFSGILIVLGEESGQAYISISADGANEIHTYFGANLRITGGHMLDPERLDLIRQSKVCVIMDPPIEAAESLARLCRENGVTVIWDPGVYAEHGLDALLPTLRYTDYFVLNHLEYENLLGTSEPKAVIEELERHVRGVKAIVKHGTKGSTLCLDSIGTTVTMDAVPLDELGLSVINTVGCGDAFIGGFASAKVEGLDDIEALRRGSAAGSFKATRKETRGGPTKEQLEKLLNRWKRL